MAGLLVTGMFLNLTQYQQTWLAHIKPRPKCRHQEIGGSLAQAQGNHVASILTLLSIRTRCVNNSRKYTLFSGPSQTPWQLPQRVHRRLCSIYTKTFTINNCYLACKVSFPPNIISTELSEVHDNLTDVMALCWLHMGVGTGHNSLPRFIPVPVRLWIGFISLNMTYIAILWK